MTNFDAGLTGHEADRLDEACHRGDLAETIAVKERAAEIIAAWIERWLWLNNAPVPDEVCKPVEKLVEAALERAVDEAVQHDKGSE